MGSDLFGSFAEASCAALVIGATSQDLVNAGWGALMYPLTISSFGIFVCLACSFLATDIRPVREEKDVEKVRNALASYSKHISCCAHFVRPLDTGSLACRAPDRRR
jgi:Na+/H+-translocating membrane pyrophosphatase